MRYQKKLSVNKIQAIRKTYTFDIQDDSQGKVNILGRDSVGRCDKTSYDHMYNSEWSLRQSSLNLQHFQR